MFIMTKGSILIGLYVQYLQQKTENRFIYVQVKLILSFIDYCLIDFTKTAALNQ
tara:strand:- start:1462 stop:1623 length:162 start_codon:yes stop_codon:yes gene_type:complete